MNKAKRIRHLEDQVKALRDELTQVQTRISQIPAPVQFSYTPTPGAASVGGTTVLYPMTLTSGTVGGYGVGGSGFHVVSDQDDEDDGGQGGVREPRFTKPSGGSGGVQIGDIEAYGVSSSEQIAQVVGIT
jgi:hypothetical protein